MSNAGVERRAILQVRWGPMALRKAVIEPGQALRVGRHESMELALPHDSQLEGAHFEISWDGAKCRIRDLKTTTGTLLDGKPTKEGLVPHGGWIRAGGTDFVAYIERLTPPKPTENEAETRQNNESRNNALNMLSTQEGLHAVLDAARSDRILTLLQESVEEYRSLYEGPKGEALADVAPYLVYLPKGSRLLAALIEEGWENSWGIYLTSEASFIETRRHLRKFLMIETEDLDDRFYFRFYDPRVLRHFLPTCSMTQLKELYGPIVRSFFCENSEGNVIGLPEPEGTIRQA